MAIVASDIGFYLSTTSGSAGNSTAGTAAGSLGKYVSTTAVPATVNGLFDDITGGENAGQTVDYRAIFVVNNNPTNTLIGAKVWVSAEVAGGASVAIATDNVAASAKGSSTAQAAVIATETTAPTGVSAFSTPTTSGAALSLGDIPAGSVKAFWVRRTATNSAALNGDGATFSVSGDTQA